MKLSRPLFGLLYGALASGIYLVFGRAAKDGGISMFAAVCVVLSVIHVVAVPRRIGAALLDWRNWLRGVLFGVTQILLFRSQASGGTTTMMASAVVGTVAGMSLGRWILRERGTAADYIALALGLVGAMLDRQALVATALGAAGGAIQGITSVTVRSLMLNGRNVSGAIGSGFLIGAIVTCPFAGGISRMFFAPSGIQLGIAVFALFLLQYAYFWIYRLLDTQKAGIVSLSRVPWSMFLESEVLGRTLAGVQVLSSVIILIGAAISLFSRSPDHASGAKPITVASD
jgi:drug/metabolite transporter (DMT)-like permease